LKQWQAEIEEFVEVKREWKILVYHSQLGRKVSNLTAQLSQTYRYPHHKYTDSEELKKFDIIITTFHSLVAEAPKTETETKNGKERLGGWLASHRTNHS
jgi:hypothetical protein